MKRLVISILAALIFIGLSSYAFANDQKATVAECIEMSKLAAEAILKDKDAALKEIADRHGRFVWKDSYVFVMDLNGKMLAHPMLPGLMKMKTLLSTPDKNPVEPKMLFVDLVVTAGTKGEGWVQYMWTKPDSTEPAEKETYVYRIPGTSMFTAAGIYR